MLSILLALLLPLALPLLAASTPKDIAAMSEGEAYTYAFSEFAAGRQSSAEHLAEARLENHPTERHMRFFAATLMRSRFDKSEPARQFARLVQENPDDACAKAASAVIMLDRHRDPDKHFAALAEVVDKQPDEPLFLWLLAIESREYDRNEQGILRYQRLCELVNPGGSLIHQTYANLLDGMKRYDEALPHRKLAVQLEPASWSYNGLGNTLRSLQRHQEACDAYAQADNLGAGGRNSAQWAVSEAALNHHAAAVEKYDQALAHHYDEVWVYEWKARSLIALGRHPDARAVLQQGLRDNPHNTGLQNLLAWLDSQP